jgi:ABC-type bacteriocin/lantibiotic exporter with double-glycine peptidase domain
MGLHTVISEAGSGFSGGQKQRILIARALISKPDIIFFDEATSALDNLSQKAVSDNLGQLMCTRVVIAHRLSTIRHCDRIIVLDKGKIAEEGTFEELMAKKGLFYEMSLRQL